MTSISPVLREAAQRKAPPQGRTSDPAWASALHGAQGQAAGKAAHHHGTAAKPAAPREHGRKQGTPPASGHIETSTQPAGQSSARTSFTGVIAKASGEEGSGAPHKARPGRKGAAQHNTREVALRSDARKPVERNKGASPCHHTECTVAVRKDHGVRHASDGAAHAPVSPPAHPMGKGGNSAQAGAGHTDPAGKHAGHSPKKHAQTAKAAHQSPAAPAFATVPAMPAGVAHGRDAPARKEHGHAAAVRTVEARPQTPKGGEHAAVNVGRPSAVQKTHAAIKGAPTVKSVRSRADSKVPPLSSQNAATVAPVAPSAAHTPVQAAQQVGASHPAPSVPDQVASTVVGLGQDAGGSARIHLHPASLGEVTINVHVTQSGVVNVHMAASHASGAQALSTSMPSLMQHLSQAGFTPGNVQTTVQPQSQSGTPSQTAGGAPGNFGQNTGGQAGQQQQQQQQTPHGHRQFAWQGSERPAGTTEADETVTAYA